MNKRYTPFNIELKKKKKTVDRSSQMFSLKIKKTIKNSFIYLFIYLVIIFLRQC